MATLMIDPIKVESKGNYEVVLTGINPTTHDCISGEIDTPGKGLIRAVWNLNGTMRDGTDKCNIDMNIVELAELAALARHLGAKD